MWHEIDQDLRSMHLNKTDKMVCGKWTRLIGLIVVPVLMTDSLLSSMNHVSLLRLFWTESQKNLFVFFSPCAITKLMIIQNLLTILRNKLNQYHQQSLLIIHTHTRECKM